MVELGTAEPTEVSSTSPARNLMIVMLPQHSPPNTHLVTALILLNRDVTVRTVLGVVLEIVLASEAGGHPLQLLLAVPFTSSVSTD